MVNITQSVAILCDGNNVERSIHTLTNDNVMVNFDELIPRLLGSRSLNRFIYFREGRHISDRLADRLHDKFYGTVVPCHKSADIPLSIKATQLASKVDTIIIMSGDSDYVDLVKHLKSEGVRIEVAAVRANTAAILLNETDYFHEITTKDVFRLPNSKKRPFVRNNSSSTASGNNTNNTKHRIVPKTTNTQNKNSQPVANKPIINTVPKKQELVNKKVKNVSDVKHPVKKSSSTTIINKNTNKQSVNKNIVKKDVVNKKSVKKSSSEKSTIAKPVIKKVVAKKAPAIKKVAVKKETKSSPVKKSVGKSLISKVAKIISSK